MDNKIRLVIAGTDVTEFVGSISWSGDYESCARILSVMVIQSHADPHIKELSTAVGSSVTFMIDGETVFSGFVVTEERATNDTAVTVECYDRGFYLNRNYLVRQYRDMTAAAITSDICGELGIAVGDIADDSTTLSRNFLRGVTGYGIIRTAWNMTGRKVCIRFDGDKLTVKELTRDAETVVIKKASNLLSASAQNSIKSAVTRIAVYDKEGNFLSAIDGEEIGEYGVLQKVMVQSDREDVAAEAEKELELNGYTQKMQVNALGDKRLLTGNTVIVQEPYTGITGLFWIIEDKHEFKNGLWSVRLSLSFDRLTDDTTAGTEVNG